ncbi:MAG: type III polyketide synthase [bacterium]
MPRIVSVAAAQPEFVLPQSSAREFCRALFGGSHAEIERLLDIFENAQIAERRIAAPIDWFMTPRPFAERNARYIDVALALSEQAARTALDAAAMTPADIDHIVFVSSTGVATPSLDARLMNRLAFGSHTRRTPIWGLGCAGGAAGLALAAELAGGASVADGARGATVLLIAVELCSLTFQAGDLSKSNLVATALFADGAAAAVIAPDAHRDRARTANAHTAPERQPRVGHTPRIVASRSTLFPDTEDVMGWEVNDAGLKVLFSRDIPTIVRRFVRENAEEFLAEHGLCLAEIDHVVAHPGGVKVMAAYEEAFGLDARALRHAREVLRVAGNMSSPTVLFVLARLLDDPEVAPGDCGLLTALGPGFSSELLLLKW